MLSAAADANARAASFLRQAIFFRRRAMTRKFLTPACLAAAAAAALLLGACKAADTAGSGAGLSRSAGKNNNISSAFAPVGKSTGDSDTSIRVSVAELQKMVEEGRVAIYDTRTKAAYDQEHIRGALSLPQNEAEARAAEMLRDKTLVFYCT